MMGRVVAEFGRAWKAVLAATALCAAAGAGMAFAGSEGLLGDAFDTTGASVSAQRDAAARAAEELAFTEANRAQRACELTVGRGETFAALLMRAGASPMDAQRAIQSMSDVFNPRALRTGQAINLVFAGDTEERLSGIAFRAEPGVSVTANRVRDGEFQARQVMMPVTYEIARIAAPVEGSLYASALRLGATDREISALADAFSYDVDFQRDVRPGDKFELVFERFYDDEGNTVRTGDLLFISLESRAGARHFYRFQPPGETRADWYDSDGRSARKFLMKTPINGAHLSSGFGMRLHPILGYSRMHRGTDFGAPVGTPIMAAGDGVIERAGPFSSYGNYVRIRHANGYETAYAHMSRFGPGIRTGASVRQGQIIGYVGTTGRSTGPHLHYEVILRGNQINPMGLRVATGRNLTGHERDLFEAERVRIDTLREARAHETGVAVARATTLSTASSTVR